MARYVVINTDDSGTGSLRQAILDANASAGTPDTITFAAGLTGTITLTTGELVPTDDVTINGDTNGDRRADITISGNDASRIFKHDAGLSNFSVALQSLTMTNGYDPFQGGAVFVLGGTFSMTDCTVRDSVSGGTAGGIYLDYTIATISNSLITGNVATGKGGGICNYGGNTTIRNTTIDGNLAGGEGGGVFKNAYGVTQGSADVGDLVMVNCTVTNNSSTAGGGGVVAGGEDTMANTVIAENSGGDISGTLEIANNNVFGGAATVNSGSANQFNIVNTGLGVLTDNGGPVQTRAIVNSGSVLINTGSNTAATGQGLATDATGAPRVQGGTVDVGATEARLILVTTAADTVANDGVTSLREALTLANANANANFIKFAANLAGQIITLTGGLSITQGVTIDGDVNGDDKADITISGNNAHRIFSITAGDTDLLSLTLVNGRADATNGDFGGAIRISVASLDIVNCTISGSRADYAGGALSIDGGTVRIANSLLTGNSTFLQEGGAINAYNGASLTITNSTLHANSSGGIGGAISIRNGAGAITSSTITGNRADADGASTDSGGGIAIASTASIALSNSVVGENVSGTGSTLNDVRGAIATGNFNVFSTDPTITTGSGNSTDTGPLGLGQLLDNGGAVLTRSPLDGSIAIEFGGNVALPLDAHDLDNDGDVTEVLPRDGRGDHRIRNGSTDAGAVEQKVDETIGGGAGNDTILGGLGNDILRGRAGADTLDGGAGADTADWSDATGAIVFTLGATGGGATANVAGIGVDTLIAMENLIGGARNDSLTGNAGANVLAGGAGNDSLAGAAGNDRLIGGLGNDTLAGGADTDTVDFSAATGPITLNLTLTGAQNTGQGFDTFSGIENLIGSAFGDTFTGQNLLNRFDGGGGNDELRGGSGNDTLNGDAGADLIVGDGGSDTISGGADIDRLYGGSSNDAIFGGAGADLLVGGPGIDRVDGGAGADRLYADGTADTFVFQNADGAGDRVFSFLTGVHKLEIDASVFGGAAGVFAFVQGSTPTPGSALQTLAYDTDDGKLYFDADGAGAGARVHILTLVGAPILAAGDILLV